MTRVLAVRLDSDGDVLITGPAVRALAGTADRLDLLVSPAGAQAGAMLPGVAEVLTFQAPWSGYAPPPVDPDDVQALIRELRRRRYDRAVIFTSFHQSPLPMALLTRMAGVPFVAATSVDYPGSLLDLRHQRPPGHEVAAALDLALHAGGALANGDDGRLAVRTPLPDAAGLVPDDPYVVLHPGASVPSRSLLPAHAAAIVTALVRAGWPVAVTGGPGDVPLCAEILEQQGGLRQVADGQFNPGHPVASVRDLAGRTDLPSLAAVLAGAAAVISGNTGPAHLAAAVGTPVVSLFSPVVPADRWAPYGVPVVLLGDQDASCAGTRARECPVPGHPCLSSVPPSAVVAAVADLCDGTHVPAGAGRPVAEVPA